MSPLRSLCCRCAAPLDLQPQRLVVAVPVHELDRQRCSLLVTCDRCGSTPLLRVPPAVAAALVAGGAGCLPAGDDRPVPEHAEPRPDVREPLGFDDLLHLHELLQTPDWFAALDPAAGPDSADGPTPPVPPTGGNA